MFSLSGCLVQSQPPTGRIITIELPSIMIAENITANSDYRP